MNLIPNINICIQDTIVGVSLMTYSFIKQKKEYEFDKLYSVVEQEYKGKGFTSISFEDYYKGLLLLFSLGKIVYSDNKIIKK